MFSMRFNSCRNDLLCGKIFTTKTLNSPSIHNIITGAMINHANCCVY